MNTEQITALLIAERDKLNAAIAALGTPVKRRGRPPKVQVDWLPESLWLFRSA